MYDAYLASGVENYMLSLKCARCAGSSAGPAQALTAPRAFACFSVTASQGHYLAPFARMMLAVAAIRDGHHAAGARHPYRALQRIPAKQPLYSRARPHPLSPGHRTPNIQPTDPVKLPKAGLAARRASHPSCSRRNRPHFMRISSVGTAFPRHRIPQTEFTEKLRNYWGSKLPSRAC